MFSSDDAQRTLQGRSMKRGLRLRLLCSSLVLLLMSVPLSSAQYSDIAYSDVTHTSSGSKSSSVDIDNSSTYLASGYDGLVAIHSVETLSLLAEIEIESSVLDLRFSPDGGKLAVSRSGSASQPDTIQIISMDTMSLTSLEQSSNARPNMISWSPDGTFLAIPNNNNGIDILRSSDMQIEQSFDGGHNSMVTCIAYSQSGNYLITGDEAGRAVMWTSQGNPTEKVWNVGTKIEACAFNSNDERIALLTEEGSLSTWLFSGGSLVDTQLVGGSDFKWSNDDDKIHVLETGQEPRILTLLSETLSESMSIYLGHQALDLAIIENQFGIRQKAFVATDTAHIAVYAAATVPNGFGETGADLDGDNIPDRFDGDDDGDAITDEYDSYCNSFTDECEREPNPDTIRHVKMFINGTSFVIEDTFVLDIQTSSEIRNLSRRSVIADSKLSQSETDLFAQAICKNMNTNHFANSWMSSLELVSGQLEDPVVQCAVQSGMTLTAQDDLKTHIFVTHTLRMNISEAIEYPFEFSIKEQPLATDSSIAQHAEMHPIDVSIHSSNSESQYWSPWWTIESSLSFTLTESEEEEQSILQRISSIIVDYPWILLPLLGIGMIGLIVLIRTKNAYGIELNFDDEEEEVNPEVEVIDTENFEKVPTEEDNPLDMDETFENTGSAFEEPITPQKPIARRKSSKRAPSDREGPITTVKRKKLVEDVGQKKVARKKVAGKRPVSKGQQSDAKPRTRRVTTGNKDPDL